MVAEAEAVVDVEAAAVVAEVEAEAAVDVEAAAVVVEAEAEAEADVEAAAAVVAEAVVVVDAAAAAVATRRTIVAVRVVSPAEFVNSELAALQQVFEVSTRCAAMRNLARSCAM